MIIWKYQLPIEDEFELNMPEGATPLAIQTQLHTDCPCLWALVDPNLPKVKREFRTFGTGYPLPDSVYIKKYIGTYQVNNGHLVFHVFEK
jgi:hypothetical protein